MVYVGQEVIDQVTLAPGFVIQNQSLGVAIEDAGFDGLDGIIGCVLHTYIFLCHILNFLERCRIGPTDLTCGR